MSIIRPYQPHDEAAVIRVWNRAMGADPIDATTWWAKVLLDPNFDPDGCLVAEIDGAVVGFLLSIRRRVPFFDTGFEPDRGWITAFGVDPDHQRRGIGGSLLDAALKRFDRLGVNHVGISPYVPNYFIPGPDTVAYASAIDLLLKRGFRTISRPISMQADLAQLRNSSISAEQITALLETGIEIRPVASSDIVPLLGFIRANFSADWHREATAVLSDLFVGDGRNVGLIIAARAGDVLGYAQHRGERFGPFGVRPDQRGNGIGGAILAEMLDAMRQKSLHVAWFLWTDETAARLYERHGFREVRRFAVMERTG